MTAVAAFEIGEYVKWTTEDGCPHIAKVKSIDGNVVTVTYGPKTREFYTSELSSFVFRNTIKHTDAELAIKAQEMVEKRGQTEFRHFYDAPKAEVVEDAPVAAPVVEAPVITISKRDRTPVEVYFNQTVAFILSRDEMVARSEILLAVDMPQSKWVQVSGLLERDSRIVTTGVKKGRRYGKKGASAPVKVVEAPKASRVEKRAAKDEQAKADAKVILTFIKKSKVPVNRADIVAGTGISNGRYAAAIKIVTPKVKRTGIKRATKYTAK